MSLASTTVFEVRPGSGNPTNGGGFVPGSTGTDWSQQNSPQYSVTDGVLNGTTTVTSATANFGADVVGNVACIAGSWYQIVSRTNATTIVVDRATGTATGQTLKIGGALDLCATAEPLLTAGMTLWIKATGTQTITSSIVLTNSGDPTNGPITWQGYHTVRGDHDGTRPLIMTSTNNVHLIYLATATGGGGAAVSFRVFDNINLSSTAGTPGNALIGTAGSGTSQYIVLSNSQITGAKSAVFSDNNTIDSVSADLVGVEIASCTSHGISGSTGMSFRCCYIHGCAGSGISVTQITGGGPQAIPLRLANCVIYNNTSSGINLTVTNGNSTTGYLLDLDHCDIVSNGSDGITLGTAAGKLTQVALQNSILYGNGGYGFNLTNTAATVVVNRNNAYGSNTSGSRNNLAAASGDVTLTADPFVGRTTNDFTLNTTAGGGAACRAAGFPGSIPSLVAAGNSDIGALQHGDPAASGGVVLSSPRRICVQPMGRPLKRSAIVFSSPVSPIILPSRRRHYPVYVPMRRSVPSMALFAHPIVMRLPIRTVARLHAVRRNAGHALFAQATNQTVLVMSPRIIR